MTPSSQSTEATPAGPASTVPSVDSLIRDRVAAIADQSVDRDDFHRRMAGELLEHFRGGLIAVLANHLPGPMLMVADEQLAKRISHQDLSDRLQTAAVAPVACNVGLVPSPTDATAGATSVTAPAGSPLDSMARGLRIEISPEPARAAWLLMYPYQSCPPAVTQVEDLRELKCYGDAARQIIPRFPEPRSSDAATDGAPQPSRVHPGMTEQTLATAQDPAMAMNRSLGLFHRDLNLNATCYRIANESRRLLKCDRTTVLIARGRRFRVAAVSGVAVVDQRGNAVTRVEQMVDTAVVMSRPLIVPSSDPLPPQIQTPLDDYFDETGVTSAIILPLHSPTEPGEDVDESTHFDPFIGDGPCIGVLVLEYFTGQVPSTIESGMSVVGVEATLALRNSLEHHSVFGLRLWKSIGGLLGGRRLPWVMLASLVGVCLLIAAMVIKVDHHVIANGSAEPTLRRDVFASIDGIVKKLHVRDGQSVKAGDVLFELENAELDSRAESLTGELETALSRLASIQAVRLGSQADPAQSGRLAIELRQVEGELAGLRGQQTILDTQRQALIITSPIDGTVVGWQLEQRLTNRPVSRGNSLASVVDPSGPWSLKLNIPDRDVGDVIEAAQTDPNLSIQFAVATLPEASYLAKLDHLATASRLNKEGQHVVDADAVVVVHPNDVENYDAFDIDSMRSGADVTAKIACGRRTALRSWFGDVFDFVQRNILFYVN
ncbi:efflux RND transporter periplasmic adaptor subunit [Rubripirellula lacrimiformis]|uniref:efflux RND transporter periplasmic adaptor subunit n=1 Tax=Rubripirellula lacrimiformis TaxID=1930273 RepID=UPI001C54E753|nr:biotin/lipoyl-binding protein [Rubripirellula lacrimiformis]